MWPKAILSVRLFLKGSWRWVGGVEQASERQWEEEEEEEEPFSTLDSTRQAGEQEPHSSS